MTLLRIITCEGNLMCGAAHNRHRIKLDGNPLFKPCQWGSKTH